MTIADILLNVSIISLFSMGLYTITDEGMAFHWLKRPFNRVQSLYFEAKESYDTYIGRGFNKTPWHSDIKKRYIQRRRVFFLCKPIILCPPCMASFWGIVIFSSLNGFGLVPYMVLCCVCASFMNYILHNLYLKMQSW